MRKELVNMKAWNRITENGRSTMAAMMAAVAGLFLLPGTSSGHDGPDRGREVRPAEKHPALPPPKPASGYQQVNLVSDVAGLAANLDTNLVNPWGLVIDRDGTLIVADNHSDLTTFYGPDGTAVNPPVQAEDEPTGITVNRSSHDFLISDGANSHPARLLYATESGKILAWNPNVDPSNAVVVADKSSSNAVYKGIALAHTRHGVLLYATDFHNARVDVFDSSFHWTGSFTDPNAEAGFAPFNVRNIGGWLFVTFAKQLGPDNEDDEAGPGNGFVDIFRPDGRLARRFASHGPLNSPWGLAVAPHHFGRFRNALLVGNFGDGTINAYNLRNGDFLGQLTDPTGAPIAIEGLWALEFGRDADVDGDDDDDGHGPNSALYFTAGPGDETHGLLGVIIPTRGSHH